MKPNEYAGLSLIAASMALAGVFAAAQTATDTTDSARAESSAYRRPQGTAG